MAVGCTISFAVPEQNCSLNNSINQVIGSKTDTCCGDSLYSMIYHQTGEIFESSVRIQATNETKIFNVFEFTQSVRVVDQWAIITDATALTNCTNVYATAYDGTDSVDLTADGMTLSGVPVNTLFTKDKVTTEPYSINNASQVRVLETIADKRIGRPFTVTAKAGVSNYIRFHVTTNTTLDFTMYLHFEYHLLNGATMGLVT